MPMTFEEKTRLNLWVQTRYDELMAEGKHGHYETLFKIVQEAIAREANALRDKLAVAEREIAMLNGIIRVRDAATGASHE